MRRIIIGILRLLTLLPAGARTKRDTVGIGMQVLFTENAGQWDSRVRMQAQLHNAALFLEEGGIMVVLREPTMHPAPQSAPLRCHAYRMSFGGATAQPTGDGRQEGYSNYFLGSSPAQWRTKVPSYVSPR